jgi:hypothetical protein
MLKDTAQVQRSTDNGLSQGKELAYDIRAISKLKVQIRKTFGNKKSSTK